MLLDSKIFIAGHKTLLGNAILRKLTSKGYTNIITKEPEPSYLHFSEINNFFKQEHPDIVFLCESIEGGIEYNINYPALLSYTNTTIQNNMFKCAELHNIKHLIFYGSSCMYPVESPQPIKEEYLLTGKLEPTSEAYSVAKISGIIGCKAYNTQYKSNRFIALVPPTIYGPHDIFDSQQSHVISALITRMHEAKINNISSISLNGTGTVKREFIYSDDAADASILAVNNISKLLNTHYNIGTGDEISINALALLISDIVGYKGNIFFDKSKPEGAKRKLLDNSKFSNLLDWKYSTQLSDGIKKTYEWYLNNKVKI